MKKWVGLIIVAVATVVITGIPVLAANEMLQLDIYTWLRLRDNVLMQWGTANDYYARYDAAGDDIELRYNDGMELANIDATGVAVTGDLDIGGQIEAGTGNHTLTTPAGLIDGAKIAPGTITGAQMYSSGASPGDMLIIDSEGDWAILAMSGHGALAASGALTIQTYTGATAGDAGVEGLVPAATAGAANRFLCVDGTWSVPGIGAVTGPGASTDRAVAIWDGTDGDTVQNSLVLISTSGGVTIPGTLTLGTGAHTIANAAGLLDGGKLQTGTVTSTQLSITGVTAGSYTVPAITVDSTGRLTAAANGSLGLIDLDDGETAYTGAAGYPIIVNTTADGWEFAAMLDPSVLPQLVGDSGSGGTAGIVPAPGVGDAAAGKYLAADGTWATPAGSGNVAGPGTSTDNALALFDGVDGQTLQDSSITSADGASLVIPGTLTLGTGANVVSNSAGLIDGGKLQAASVGLAALDQGGATDGQALVWDDTGGVWEPGTVSGGGSASAFTDLSDAPSAYTGAGGKYVKVKATEDGVEFSTVSVSGDDMGAVDTEAALESALTDVSDVMTDNDATWRPILLTATGATFPTSNGADGPTKIETSTNKNIFYTVDFDKDADEYAYWTCISLPYDYKSGTTLKVRVSWTAIAGTTGGVCWVVGANCFDDGESLDAAKADEVTMLDSFSAINYVHSTAYYNLTITGTPGAGDILMVYLYRDVSAETDTFDADANLLNVEIAYQAEFMAIWES